MIELDGNYGEGGGQIVRTALALSCLTKKPFKVTNIRKGRKKSGLKNQHLKAVEILKEITGAYVKGDELGSEELVFYPREIKIKNIEADIGTAGSLTLLLQSLMPFLIFGKKRVKLNLKGGTDVKWSPSYDYFANVIIPQLRRFADIECKLLRRGYFPKGGGEIEVKIKPKEYSSINLLKQYDLVQIKGVAHASKSLQNKNVAERMKSTSKLMLSSFTTNITANYSDSFSDGCGLTLFAIYSRNDEVNLNPTRLGVCMPGEKGISSEEIAQKTSESLIADMRSECPVDEHLADNLIPYLAIAGGCFKAVKISQHTLTNIYVVEKFLKVKFNIENNIIKVEQAASLS